MLGIMTLIAVMVCATNHGFFSATDSRSMTEHEQLVWRNLQGLFERGDISNVNSILKLSTQAIALECSIDRSVGRFGILNVKVSNCDTTGVVLVNSDLTKMTAMPYRRNDYLVDDWLIQPALEASFCKHLNPRESMVFSWEFKDEIPSNYMAKVSFAYPVVVSIEPSGFEVHNIVVKRCETVGVEGRPLK